VPETILKYSRFGCFFAWGLQANVLDNLVFFLL